MTLAIAKSQTLTSKGLLQLIDFAREAEICRDPPAAFQAFKLIWQNSEVEPDFSFVKQIAIRAELYRLAGFLLCYYGKSKNKKNYQERAKNLLTIAVNLFLDEGLKDKSDEAQVMLALCYWYSGDTENCEFILTQIEREYEDSPLDSAYLQVKITRAITHWTKEEYDEALAMVETLSDKMPMSHDNRLKMSYHNQAGAMLLKKGFYEKAHYHFQHGIKYAIESGSLTFEATQYNNISILYQALGEKDPAFYDNAFENVQKALSIFESIDAPGWTAVTLDTMAGILMQQRKYDTALTTICRSVEMLREGDDYSVLVDSLYTRFQILIKQSRFVEAMTDFSELIEISRLHIGEFKVDQFNQRLAESIYFRQNLSLTDELHVYKKFLVTEALIKNKNHRQKSADVLGITRGGLYEILEDQMPELYSELNIYKRDWSPSAGKQNKSQPKQRLRLVASKNSHKHQTTNSGIVQKLNIPNNNIVYAGMTNLNPANIYCFHLSEQNAKIFKVNTDIIVLCDKDAIDSDDEIIIIAQNLTTKKYVCAVREINQSSFNLFDVGTETDYSILEYKIIAKVIAFCPLDESSGDIIVFRSFNEFNG